MKLILSFIFTLSFSLSAFSQNIKPFGRIDTHEIVSVCVDENGVPRADDLKPNGAGDDWIAPVLVPVVKVAKPAINEETQKVEPTLIWASDKVTRDWVVSSSTINDLKAKAPASVTKRQLREWLIRNDLFETVENAIGAIPDAKEKMIAWNWWETSQSYEIAHPLILQLGASIGMTETQIYQAWIAASKL